MKDRKMRPTRATLAAVCGLAAVAFGLPTLQPDMCAGRAAGATEGSGLEVRTTDAAGAGAAAGTGAASAPVVDASGSASAAAVQETAAGEGGSAQAGGLAADGSATAGADAAATDATAAGTDATGAAVGTGADATDAADAATADAAASASPDARQADARQGKEPMPEEDSAKVADASGAEAAADGYAARLPGLRSRLSSVLDQLSGMRSVADEYAEKMAALEQQEQDAATREQRARQVLEAVAREREAEHEAKGGIAALLSAGASAVDMESRAYLLDKLAADREEAVEQARAEQEDLQGQAGALQAEEAEKLAAEAHERADTIEQGNEIAADIEQAASDMRAQDQAAGNAVADLDTRYEGADEAREQASSSEAGHLSTRASALSVAGTWYDFVDALSGTHGALSFGTGADFSMEKEAFVKKWGDAIDAFYAQFGAESGFTPPLQGHGAEMAAAAYERKIDPRLCAAVSIAESSGGKYCIKSCNAWGWGAADADPYGGASSWGSWAEAIEAWHEGMAGSKTGLADAATVGELGEIYCSTRGWASTVSQQMEKISACARAAEEAAAQEGAAGGAAESGAADAADGADAGAGADDAAVAGGTGETDE